MGYSGRLEDGYHGGAVLGTARRSPRVTALLVEVVERIGTREARRDPWAGATGRAGERGFVLVALVRAGKFLHDDHEAKEDRPDANHAYGDRYCMSGHRRLHHNVAKQSWLMSRRPQ